MWNPATRRQYSRAGLRYASDLTDTKWALLEPLLPSAPRRGRRRAWPDREIVNAILYVLRAGCAWRLLPDSFPPWRTVYRWFAHLRDGGVLEAINHRLVILDRERAGREASPTAAVIDSQSTKTTEAGGPRGYDAGKKVMGRKRHAMVETDGRALVLHAHPGSVQDPDFAARALDSLAGRSTRETGTQAANVASTVSALARHTAALPTEGLGELQSFAAQLRPGTRAWSRAR